MYKNSPSISLLTAGRDKPYAIGMAQALIDAGISFEFLGSDEIDSPVLHDNPLVVFRNMRGDQAEDAGIIKKVLRVLRYYLRLISYGLRAKPKIFHILWNNKFEWFDRTILMLLYRACGRKIVFTAHNVNIGERDGTDSAMHRWTLRMQYRLSDAVFVHTVKMRDDLHEKFAVPIAKIKTIPFPINSTPPTTDLSTSAARSRLGLGTDEKVLLMYGQIARYKGIEFLLKALAELREQGGHYRLVIGGRVKKNADAYWGEMQELVQRLGLRSSIVERIEFIPDEETEIYFKAADALVLPYTYIFQSGVLFLSYNFGLPVIAADVGSMKDAIVEGETGFVFRAQDAEDLARAIQEYFKSALYRQLEPRRTQIREFALENYSWSRVASVTTQVYSELLGVDPERLLQTS